MYGKTPYMSMISIGIIVTMVSMMVVIITMIGMTVVDQQSGLPHR